MSSVNISSVHGMLQDILALWLPKHADTLARNQEAHMDNEEFSMQWHRMRTPRAGRCATHSALVSGDHEGLYKKLLQCQVCWVLVLEVRQALTSKTIPEACNRSLPGNTSALT